MPAKPTTVAEFLAALPPDRRKTVQALRKVIRANADPRLKEGIQYGGIGYFVPHSVYPAGYHCDASQPLPFAGVMQQKNHVGLSLFCLYTEPSESERFATEWKRAGKRLDMGKSCVRIKQLEDVPLDVVGRAVKRMTVSKFLAVYEGSLNERQLKQQRKREEQRAPAGKPAPARKKAAKKKTAKRSARKA